MRWPPLLALVLTCFGCGASVEPEGMTLASTNPDCPSAVPKDGDPCPGDSGYSCEYGYDPNPNCSTIVECNTRRSSCHSEVDCENALKDRVWATAPRDEAECEEKPGPPPKPLPKECPKDRPAVGTACPADALCVYSCSWFPLTCVDGFWSLAAALPGECAID